MRIRYLDFDDIGPAGSGRNSGRAVAIRQEVRHRLIDQRGAGLTDQFAEHTVGIQDHPAAMDHQRLERAFGELPQPFVLASDPRRRSDGRRRHLPGRRPASQPSSDRNTTVTGRNANASGVAASIRQSENGRIDDSDTMASRSAIRRAVPPHATRFGRCPAEQPQPAGRKRAADGHGGDDEGQVVGQ